MASAQPSSSAEDSDTHTGDDPMFPVNHQFHVLLVEDDALTLKYVEQLLRKCNYQGMSWFPGFMQQARLTNVLSL
jgi:hypothetical protein